MSGITFDTATYLANKTAQSNKDGAANGGRTDWTSGQILAEIEKAGLTPEQHYAQWGRKEGVTPYVDLAGFDTAAYLKNKTAQSNKEGAANGGRTDWTEDQILKAMQDGGVNPLEHYLKWGIKEGVSPIAAPDEMIGYPSSDPNSDDRRPGMGETPEPTPKPPTSPSTGQNNIQDDPAYKALMDKLQGLENRLNTASGEYVPPKGFQSGSDYNPEKQNWITGTGDKTGEAPAWLQGYGEFKMPQMTEWLDAYNKGFGNFEMPTDVTKNPSLKNLLSLDGLMSYAGNVPKPDIDSNNSLGALRTRLDALVAGQSISSDQAKKLEAALAANEEKLQKFMSETAERQGNEHINYGYYVEGQAKGNG